MNNSCRINSDRIVEMSGEVASDIKSVSGNNPEAMLISVMKDEINAGKFPFQKEL